MGKIREVTDIRDRDDAIQWAKKKGGNIEEATNHTKVNGPRGSTFLPRHKGDFKTGTRYAIIKQYIAIGLGVLAAAIPIGYATYSLIF